MLKNLFRFPEVVIQVLETLILSINSTAYLTPFSLRIISNHPSCCITVNITWKCELNLEFVDSVVLFMVFPCNLFGRCSIHSWERRLRITNNSGSFVEYQWKIERASFNISVWSMKRANSWEKRKGKRAMRARGFCTVPFLLWYLTKRMICW